MNNLQNSKDLARKAAGSKNSNTEDEQYKNFEFENMDLGGANLQDLYDDSKPTFYPKSESKLSTLGVENYYSPHLSER